MRNYNNYKVWIESHNLVLFIYRNILSEFPADEKFELKSQMKRAAYSIPFNIAEGCGRHSEKDFTHFLDMSLGSANELDYCILLTRDLGYINSDQYRSLNERINSIKAMLIGLIKFIREPKTN